MKHTQHNIIGVLAFPLLMLLSWKTISFGTPTLDSPFNIPVVLVTLLSDSMFLGVLFIPLCFVVWCWPVLLGAAYLPLRSIVLLGISVTLSVLWHIVGFSYGIQYQGIDFVIGVSIVNLLFVCILITLAVIGRRRPQYHFNLLFHVALFAWLAYYAFPYLGELL